MQLPVPHLKKLRAKRGGRNLEAEKGRCVPWGVGVPKPTLAPASLTKRGGRNEAQHHPL
jgi:hypothetical protein